MKKYLVKKPYEPIKVDMPKFNTLRMASLYCDNQVCCEDFEIYKIENGIIVDIYKLRYLSMFVETISYKNGRKYTYLKNR